MASHSAAASKPMLMFKHQSAASNYKFAERFTGPPSKGLLEFCGLLGPGVTKETSVLDNATGTGIVPRYLNERFPSPHTPKILAADFAPPMVEATEQEAKRLGWSTTSVQLADAQDTKLPANSFDYVVTSFGVMGFPKPFDALRDNLRIAKSGGIVAYTTWHELGWFPSVQEAAKRENIPIKHPKDMWSGTGHWEDIDWNRTKFEDLGFQGVRAELHPFDVVVEEGAEFYVQGLAFFVHHALLQELAAEEREAAGNRLLATLVTVLKEQFCDGPINLSFVAIRVSGKKP